MRPMSTASNSVLAIALFLITAPPLTCGTDKLGVFRSGSWYLDFNGNGAWEGGVITYSFGSGIAVTGDWSGSGGAKIGSFEQGFWRLDLNGNGVFDSGEPYFSWGSSGWTPVVGDRNGDGRAKAGVVGPNGVWYLDYNGSRAWETGIDKVFGWGSAH